ncbi:hypothetical protein OE766_01780 [Pararhizobium sp. YC-54]|uniref:hypothetical protein n=1 Tax=Pararhizobium sp. YC-54 TaxID=2986920 RepID=UPI0021F6C788|nr:hypothetical protein [Pararhizobium sp. YC-54]MCV9996975.1 hypothetical protein [Pararhizobium sp. YC-54]
MGLKGDRKVAFLRLCTVDGKSWQGLEGRSFQLLNWKIGKTPVFRATLRCQDETRESARRVSATGTIVRIGHSRPVPSIP